MIFVPLEPQIYSYFPITIPLSMRIKQSILEDFQQPESPWLKDMALPAQKYIHFWDFMELDFAVHEFQAKMGMAIKNLKVDMSKRYKDHYTRALIQTPDKFIAHNRELMEMEYMLENPFFLAVLHFALTKDIDDANLHGHAIEYKNRLLERRFHIQENLREDIKAKNEFVIK
jgi:hypothetical protein